MRKNKKLLLASVAAMGALALGVGATSTFAWFQASTTAKSAAATGNGSIVVGEAIYPIGDVEVPMILSANATMTGVGLAHYGGETDGVNAGKAPYLTTGYADANHVFHDLGYKASGDPNAKDPVLYEGVTSLYTTLTVTIDVHFTIAYSAGVNGAWYQEQACSNLATGRGNANYFKDKAGNILLGSTVLNQLDGLEVDVGVKSNSSRVRFFKTSAASDDSDLGNMDSGDKVTISTVTYARVGTGKFSLAGIKTNSLTTGASPYFYVLGNNATGESGDITLTNAVSLAIGGGTARS